MPVKTLVQDPVVREDNSDSEKPSSDQQTDIGLVEHSTISSPVLVIAEAWPSFAFALDACGYTNVTIWVKAHILPWLQQIQGECRVLRGFRLEELVSAKKMNQSLGGGEKVWFIQGNDPFVKQWLRIGEDREVDIKVGLSSTISRRFAGLGITHANVGGVSNGRWKVQMKGEDATLKHGWNTGNVRRQLRHLLSSTKKGITVGESALKGDDRKRKRGKNGVDKVYTPDMRVNSHVERVEVIAPSVFSPSKLVKQYLTQDELLECYDFGPRIRQIVALGFRLSSHQLLRR